MDKQVGKQADKSDYKSDIGYKLSKANFARARVQMTQDSRNSDSHTSDLRASDLQTWAADNGVAHFLINFTDMLGAERSKLVPSALIERVQRDGGDISGNSCWMGMSPIIPDMRIIPDSGATMQLPWQPDIAWVPCMSRLEGKVVENAPRQILARQIERARAKDIDIMTGVEPEFFLVSRSGRKLHDRDDRRRKSCYIQAPLMRQSGLLTEISSCMSSLGWGPFQIDHEDANGQFEINWHYSDPLSSADRHSFFKFMTRSLASRHGARATFMPKPFESLAGNGCHVHISLWRGEHDITTDDAMEQGLSLVARRFLAGVMRHAPAMTAITNPLVNSYKRLNNTAGAASLAWTPNRVSWSGNNRSHMIRVPARGRFEFRLADTAANPYLLQALIIAAGLDGIERKLDPGASSALNMFDQLDSELDAPRLPLNLLDAVRLFAHDEFINSVLGQDFVDIFARFKMNEWSEHCRHLSDWERDSSIDC